MKAAGGRWKWLASLGVVLTIFVLVQLGLLLPYKADNKYALDGPRGVGGVLTLTREEVEARGVLPLVDGWEYYPGALLTPADIAAGSPAPQDTFIGCFGTFSQDNADSSPFGQATYRLRIRSDPSLPSLSLMVPEIYSACRIWVNGVLLAENGCPDADGYRAHIQERVVSVPSGEADVVVETANYSQYYSGMTYPPLLGLPDGVTRAVQARFLFYGALCFFSLGAAAVSVFLWMNRKKPFYRAYGLLAVCFAAQVAYPFLHAFGAQPVRLLYVLEDTARFATLLCMVAITSLLCRDAVPRVLRRAMLGFSVLLCAVPALFQYAVFPPWPQTVAAYGTLMHAGKVLMSLYLLGAAILGCVRRGVSPWLLAGNAVLAAGIGADFLFSGIFEPIRFGWQDEYTGFLTVLLFTALMASYSRRLLLENERLTLHLQEEVGEKTAHLSALLSERKRFLSGVAHDLKAPVAVIRTYTDYIRQSGVAVDDEVLEYIALIERKSGQLENSLTGLQMFNLENEESEKTTLLDLRAFLKSVYHDTKPYADADGIYYRLALPEHEGRIACQRNRLYRALENLVLNATEYTPAGGTITLTLLLTGEEAVISLADTGVGIPPENLPRVFDYRFSTNNGVDKVGARGLGLYFVRITAEEMGGSIAVSSEVGTGSVFTLRLPLTREE